MTKFSFSSTMKEAEKNYNLGKGQYFKIQEGDNQIRLISECLPHESVFKGKKQFKFLCQILDRKDGEIKPFFMPVTVFKNIESLQLDADYSFDEVPMPYDIKIRAVGAGTLEVKYTVIPGAKRFDLTEEEKKKLAESPNVHELQKKVYENMKEEDRPMKEPGDEGYVEVENLTF